MARLGTRVAAALVPGAGLAMTLLMGLLAGCGSGVVQTVSPPGTPPAPIPAPPSPAPVPGSGTGLAFSGTVRGGGRLVAGAAVQIFAAGVSGVGAGATPLLAAALTTDAAGVFRVPAGYSCPGPAREVYAIARGGSVGSGTNMALAELAMLGPCSGIADGETVVVSESTTVAGVFALQQFLAADGSIGAAASNGQGLANAAALARALVSDPPSVAPGAGFPATVTAPTAKLNTLANLLSGCGASPAACPALLSATAYGGNQPADTLAAALAIAKAPAANVHALYQAASTATVFSPALTAEPRDWMLSITHRGGGLTAEREPTAVAIDASGTAWVASYGGVLAAISPVGVPVFADGLTGGGLRGSYALAIDGKGNVWVSNSASDGSVNGGLGTVTEVSSTGQFLSGASGFANDARSGGFSNPLGIAIDPDGTVWVVNTHNGTVTRVNSSGETISGGAGYGSSALAFPSPIALDASGSAWVGNMNTQEVVRISADGRSVEAVRCCDGVQAVAIDAGGSVWAASYFGGYVSRVAKDGTVAQGSPYTGATLRTPSSIAVDGAGNVWVGNLRERLLTELAGSNSATPGAVLSPAAGWASDAGLDQPYSLAIDASGNLWIANFAAGTVTELIGVAGPVKTPLAGPVRQP